MTKLLISHECIKKPLLPPKRGKIKAKTFENIKETVINLIGMGSPRAYRHSAASANQQLDEKKNAWKPDSFYWWIFQIFYCDKFPVFAHCYIASFLQSICSCLKSNYSPFISFWLVRSGTNSPHQHNLIPLHQNPILQNRVYILPCT